MSFIRREFYTKDKEIQQYLDRLMNHGVTETPPKIAQTISRNNTIRKIRDIDRKNPLILIGADQKYHVSIIRIRQPVKITKKGDRYYFSL